MSHKIALNLLDFTSARSVSVHIKHRQGRRRPMKSGAASLRHNGSMDIEQLVEAVVCDAASLLSRLCRK